MRKRRAGAATKEETFTNPKKWKKTFDVLVKLLEDQKSQMETLDDERKRLEDRIRVQYERWLLDVRSLENQVDQMRMQVRSAEMSRMVEAARADLVTTFRKKQDSVCKLKLGLAEDDLNDFKEWFDILSHRCPDGQVISKEDLNRILSTQEQEQQTPGSSRNIRKKRRDTKALEDEISNLKQEYEKLSLKTSSELSALATEKEFAWNQYREMELGFNGRLQLKDEELRRANSRIEELLENVRRLESSNQEKDVKISELMKGKCGAAQMAVAAKVEKDKEILGFLSSQEKRVRSSSGTRTTLTRCTTRSDSKRLKDSKHVTFRSGGGSSASQRKELASSSEGPKRKSAEAVEIPKLFTSNFKIPKLKKSDSSSVSASW